MYTIKARNVNDALPCGISWLKDMGQERPSRNGPVLVAPTPVTTVYSHPRERVMLWPKRDANPFFHLVEALWMIAGRNDLKTLTPFVKRMSSFSDDGGKTQPGAYGHRWRNHFVSNEKMMDGDYRLDQIAWAANRLQADPNDRRVVIQMYDAEVDQYAADRGGKDIPCNLIALPTISSDGRLDLTVFNRSNDAVWGAYGANAVHFSVLQEVLAGLLDRPVGKYWQIANNFHAYLDTVGKAEGIQKIADPYAFLQVEVSEPMFPGLTLEEITDDIERFLDDPARPGLRSSFLRKIACPMVMAHRAFKKEGTEPAREIINQMPANNDWRFGAEVWLNNRDKAKDDGVTYE